MFRSCVDPTTFRSLMLYLFDFFFSDAISQVFDIA